MLPTGFSLLADPRLIYSMDYFSGYNFVGRRIKGYLAPVCIITEEAKAALLAVQDELDKLSQGFRLKIFDTYRPCSAVDDFTAWSKEVSDQKMKAQFYPNIEKTDLFKLKYLAEQSSHSRGSTVDLTIAVAKKEANGRTYYQELEMGTSFDFFDEMAHTKANNISDLAKKNREFFVSLMEKHGFENYPFEWWHFTLKNEPFPNDYFNFPVQEYA